VTRLIAATSSALLDSLSRCAPTESTLTGNKASPRAYCGAIFFFFFCLPAHARGKHFSPELGFRGYGLKVGFRVWGPSLSNSCDPFTRI